MTIIYGGKDITAEVTAEAKRRGEQALRSPVYRTHFDSAISHLNAARQSLNTIPAPWMHDCVHEGIKIISDAIEALRSVTKLEE